MKLEFDFAIDFISFYRIEMITYKITVSNAFPFFALTFRSKKFQRQISSICIFNLAKRI